MRDLFLTNTFSKQKERFAPLHDDKVSLYVCGITPYDFAHIGHGRCYVAFDLLVRVLGFLGYKVTYVRNFTDIDDKIIARAIKEFGDERKFAAVAHIYSEAFTHDLERLGCIVPTHQPCVTGTIPEIIAFIQGLIEEGKAYESNGDVYFSVRSFPSYGLLSGRDINDLIAGARVEKNELKKDPLDFALWKSTEPGTYWQSPWGSGRPGWHIECSAMAHQFLGKTIDIHGGGMDLIFPHHENERAQSEGLFNDAFVRIWMHVAFVRIDQEKMSKSLGNFFTLRQVFDQIDPMALRYYLLTHHYTIPLDFNFDDLVSSGRAYERLINAFSAVQSIEPAAQKLQKDALLTRMIERLADDLNVAGFMGLVFEHLNELAQDAERGGIVKYLLQQLLGLSLQPLAKQEVAITPEIQQLIDARKQARAERNFKLADELRDQLKSLGVDVKDDKV